MSILTRIRWARVSLAAAALAAAAWWTGADVETNRPPTKNLLVNRPWVDHMPKDGRDMVSRLLFLQKDTKQFGAAIRGSNHRMFLEAYDWKPTKNGLMIQLKQNGRRIWVQATARECRREAPKPLDLCLDIGILGRGITLYSKKSWSQDDLLMTAPLPTDPDAVGEDINVFDVLDIEQ
ncbi:MAG: hypothetical protein AAFV53_43230 [Myxococcota bacterium]